MDAKANEQNAIDTATVPTPQTTMERFASNLFMLVS